MQNTDMHTKVAEASAMIAFVLCNALTENLFKVWQHLVNGLPNWPTFETAAITELSVALPVLVILHYASKGLRRLDQKFAKKQKKDEIGKD